MRQHAPPSQYTLDMRRHCTNTILGSMQYRLCSPTVGAANSSSAFSRRRQLAPWLAARRSLQRTSASGGTKWARQQQYQYHISRAPFRAMVSLCADEQSFRAISRAHITPPARQSSAANHAQPRHRQYMRGVRGELSCLAKYHGFYQQSGQMPRRDRLKKVMAAALKGHFGIIE